MASEETITLNQEEYEHLVRRERAIGRANAVRNFSSLLPEILRQACHGAWEEGLIAGDSAGMDSADNPYKADESRTCAYDFGPCVDPDCNEDLHCDNVPDEGQKFCPEHKLMEE